MSIQELIQEYNEKNDEKIYKDIINSLKTTETLYVAYCPYIRNYYVDFKDQKPSAYIFSKEEYYKKFEKYMSQSMFILKEIQNGADERILLMQDFYRSGIEQIIVDNGQQHLKMSLFDITEKLDFSNLPYVKRPVMNPNVVLRADYFFECISAKKADMQMEADMFKEVKNGKYLIPIDASKINLEKGNSDDGKTTIKQNSAISFPIIKNTEGKSFYPIFTDWTEFFKFDREKSMQAILYHMKI